MCRYEFPECSPISNSDDVELEDDCCISNGALFAWFKTIDLESGFEYLLSRVVSNNTSTAHDLTNTKGAGDVNTPHKSGHDIPTCEFTWVSPALS